MRTLIIILLIAPLISFGQSTSLFKGLNLGMSKKEAKKEYKTFLKKYPSSRLVSAVRLELKQLNSRMAKK